MENQLYTLQPSIYVQYIYLKCRCLRLHMVRFPLKVHGQCIDRDVSRLGQPGKAVFCLYLFSSMYLLQYYLFRFPVNFTIYANADKMRQEQQSTCPRSRLICIWYANTYYTNSFYNIIVCVNSLYLLVIDCIS